MNSHNKIPLYNVDKLTLLYDRDYLPFLRSAIQEARLSIYATQFLTDARPVKDPYAEIRFLGHALAEARWRGIDIKIIFNEVRVGDYNHNGNFPFQSFLANRRVPCRQFNSINSKTTLHSKMIIIDEIITITGSHNWTPSAFNINSEASVAIESKALAQESLKLFDSYWSNSSERWMK